MGPKQTLGDRYETVYLTHIKRGSLAFCCAVNFGGFMFCIKENILKGPPETVKWL